MKNKIILSLAVLGLIIGLSAFSYNNTVNNPPCVFTVTSVPNAPGTYCGPTSGSFNTGATGKVGIGGLTANSSYTFCVNASGGGSVTVTTDSSGCGSVVVDNGSSCPCGN